MPHIQTIPLPDAEIHQGWRSGSPIELSGKRELTRKINALLIGLQDVSAAYSEHHCDTSGRVVAEANLELIAMILDPFKDVLEILADEPGQYGFDGLEGDFDLSDMISTLSHHKRELA